MKNMWLRMIAPLVLVAAAHIGIAGVLVLGWNLSSPTAWVADTLLKQEFRENQRHVMQLAQELEQDLVVIGLLVLAVSAVGSGIWVLASAIFRVRGPMRLRAASVAWACLLVCVVAVSAGILWFRMIDQRIGLSPNLVPAFAAGFVAAALLLFYAIGTIGGTARHVRTAVPGASFFRRG